MQCNVCFIEAFKFYWSCRSVYRREDLSVAFKLLSILSWFRFWGAVYHPPPTPCCTLPPPPCSRSTPHPLLHTIPPHHPVHDLPPHPCSRSTPPPPVAQFTPHPLFHNIPPHTSCCSNASSIKMHDTITLERYFYGVTVRWISMAWKAGPLETCMQGLPFI